MKKSNQAKNKCNNRTRIALLPDGGAGGEVTSAIDDTVNPNPSLHAVVPDGIVDAFLRQQGSIPPTIIGGESLDLKLETFSRHYPVSPDSSESLGEHTQ
jgi:hypothetical protein